MELNLETLKKQWKTELASSINVRKVFDLIPWLKTVP